MNAVVAGFQGERAAGNRYRAIRMDGIVRGVNAECAAAQ